MPIGPRVGQGWGPARLHSSKRAGVQRVVAADRPNPAEVAGSVREFRIAVSQDVAVSALLLMPPDPSCLYVFAHGAGAGMRHSFIEAVADGLARRGIATLRYQFPYMEHGSRRPDPPHLAHATVRAAVDVACDIAPGLALIAGGKSFGGRMTSQAQADAPLAGVVGLAFLGWPLHPAGKPAAERADHLSAIKVSTLFIQGTHDALADPQLLKKIIKGLGRRAPLFEIPDGDHSFHVPARIGRTDEQVLSIALDPFRDGLRLSFGGPTSR